MPNPENEAFPKIISGLVSALHREVEWLTQPLRLGGCHCAVVTLLVLSCLVQKTGGEELAVEREVRLVAIYQFCQAYPGTWHRQARSSRYKQGQAGKMNEPAGATLASRTQLFQLTSAALPLLTWFIQWKMDRYHSKTVNWAQILNVYKHFAENSQWNIGEGETKNTHTTQPWLLLLSDWMIDNPAQGRHWIFRCVQVEAPIPKNLIFFVYEKKRIFLCLIICHVSCGGCVTCHVLHVTCHTSPVTCN